MKKLLLAALAFVFIAETMAQKVKYKILTSIESIVPMGIGIRI